MVHFILLRNQLDKVDLAGSPSFTKETQSCEETEERGEGSKQIFQEKHNRCQNSPNSCDPYMNANTIYCTYVGFVFFI